jgi:sulfatase maturation enzyme AslB (radical SAM superfamily)
MEPKEIVAVSETMCILPWDSAAIRPFSTALPCCRFNLPNEIKFADESNVNNDFRNSSTWVKTRESMLAGEKVASCIKCYREEESGAESMRTLNLKNYREKHRNIIPITAEILPLRFLEIAFSNLCNLACVSCSRKYSSTWAAEDYKHGKLPLGQKSLIQHNNDLGDIDLSQLTAIKIIGGEPFMDQVRFIALLKRLNLKNLSIRISTNGTVLPNTELKSLIDKCKHVALDISLDGVGSVNEWYRWPTKWHEVVDNMNQFDAWWSKTTNVSLQIHTVINAYNIWTLDKTIQFMINNYPSWGINSDWIVSPAWQSLSIIPSEHKKLLTEKLVEWNNNINPNVRYGKANPFKVSIDRLKDNLHTTSNWEEFKSRSLELANNRKLDLFAMVPDLKEPFNC